MDKRLETEILKIVNQILPKMSNEMKTMFINTPENKLAIFHFGFGTWIRNNILTEQNEIFKIFVQNGFDHKDIMSDIIIRELHEYLRR